MSRHTLLLAMALAFPVDLVSADGRPNILVIFTDDHGHADLGCQGVVGDIRTPHIDRLAAEGVRFTSGYVTAPQCVPSRAGLLTGRYQNRFGVESNGEPLGGFGAEQTIAERLKKAGYATGMTGKWHLGPPAGIRTHGFDDVYFKNANRPGWATFDLDGRDRPPGAEDSNLYHLDVNSAATCAFIERHHEEPFFFYCAYRAPHVPLDAPANYLGRFPGDMPERRRQALAMISAIDDGVGRILAKLREHALDDRTVIFLIGDNGAPLKIHKLDTPGGGPGWDGSLNDPLNGEKGMLTEGGIRVPFVVCWRGGIPGGQVVDHPVISLDVAATAVALADLPPDPSLDGVNLVPYLRGENDGVPHETLYWRWIAQSAVREGRWKYLRGGAREYLFDLDADREEHHNVLEEHPEIAERLRSRLTRWASELDPPGLRTRAMAPTWERYFDHYLDGKAILQPPAARGRSGAAGDDRAGGWVARNSRALQEDGVLRVRARSAARRPFIAVAGLDLPSRSTAVVRIRAATVDRAGLAWREAGQRDFPPGQVVQFGPLEAGEWQVHHVPVPAKGRVIHVRLLLPPAGADIDSVAFADAGGKVVRSWEFEEVGTTPARRGEP